MRHELKIQQNYLIRILGNDKTFEIRKNDRDYQVNDTIKFMPLESDNYDVYEGRNQPIPEYNIDYIHSGFGMEKDYVVLGISREQ